MQFKLPNNMLLDFAPVLAKGDVAISMLSRFGRVEGSDSSFSVQMTSAYKGRLADLASVLPDSVRAPLLQLIVTDDDALSIQLSVSVEAGARDTREIEWTGYEADEIGRAMWQMRLDRLRGR